MNLPTPSLVLKNQYGEESINSIVPLKTVVTLTAAQVIALNATPQTLVPAVAGKVIKVSDIKLAYTYGSAAFVVGSNKFLIAQYHSIALLIQKITDTGFLDQTANKEIDLFGPGVGGLGNRGVAVELTSDDTSLATGTGSSLTITTYYSVI